MTKIGELWQRRLLLFAWLMLQLLPKDGMCQDGALAISYGQMAFKSDFLTQLRTIDAYNFSKPIHLVGIAANGDIIINRKGKSSGHFLLEQVVPQKFNVNDTVSGKLSGMLFGCGLGWDLFPKNEHFDFILDGGIQIGRLKVRQADFNQFKRSSNNLHLKNMFISPKLSTIVKVNFDKFGFFVQADYAYDVSDPRWKEKILAYGKPDSVPLPDFWQGGLLFHVGIVSNLQWYSSLNDNNPTEEDDINY